jgi:hypothetical protein
MPCARCDSGCQLEFSSEIAIHFTGLEGMNKPHVLVFPKVLVCLDCGFSRFVLGEKDLRLLGKGDMSSSAARNAS